MCIRDSDNINDIAIRGLVCITAAAEPHWGGPESQPFRSDLLTDPTWLDLCVVLHLQIQSTRDRQHVFLEGVSPTGESCRFVTWQIEIHDFTPMGRGT